MEPLWRYAVTGNIKKSHADEDGILRYGVAAFKGNAKVYLCGRVWEERIPAENRSEISVLGLCRGRRYYVDSVPIAWIENVRVTRVYTPKVLEIMSNWEFEDGWWGNSQEDKEDALAFVRRWNAALHVANSIRT